MAKPNYAFEKRQKELAKKKKKEDKRQQKAVKDENKNPENPLAVVDDVDGGVGS